MKLYNTLTQKKEEFIPIIPKKVKIYSCGPTVYNYIHVGNARPICVFDTLRKYFEYKGFEVCFVQNFTDIDDKIIKKANEEKTDFFAVSQKYIEEYKKDAEGLNVKEATFHPRATENIQEIIDMISSLVEKNYAYQATNGDVYFKTRAFKDYGKLSKQTVSDLQSGAIIKIDEDKTDPLDFALWKAAKEGEPYWESPWGKGRPGWHIECSVMAAKHLGKTIDIHCGGQDLIFPHHENEIAQSECCNNVQFANYWLHNGYINIDSKKMSKSLGNFFTVREVAEKYGYEAIRYLIMSAHYTSPINFSGEILEQCNASLERLYNFKNNLEFAISNSSKVKNIVGDRVLNLKVYEDKFESAMDDDLNTADGISAIFELVKDVNAKILSKSAIFSDYEYLIEISNLFKKLTYVLGIVQKNQDVPGSISKEEIERLIKERDLARKEKNWKRADEIRDNLSSKNVLIEDTPNGTKYTFK